MQNLKIMFRSPRFVAGFLMVLLVVCYAVFYPMINTADPKRDRLPNPFYDEVEELRGLLEAKDSEAIYAELDKLEASDSNEEDLAVLAEVRAALDAGGLTKAASGAKQIKKKSVLYNGFEALRGYLGVTEGSTPDEAKAREELAALAERYSAVPAIVDAINAGSYEDASKAIEEAGLAEEFADLVALFPAAGEEAGKDLTKAVDTLAKDYGFIAEIGARLDAGGYADAEDALKGIQKTYLVAKDMPPSKQFPLGTDNFSRDILLEMAYGARLSLLVGIMAGCIATAIGLIIGLVAGFSGGIVDNILSAVNNIFIVIPSMVILILISIALGQMKDAWVTGLIIGLTAWPWTARSVRAQTTSLRNRDHVNMARITGYGMPRILLTEILPYIASYVVMAFILQVAAGISSEATLAILGLGDPTAISLGRMINWAMNYEAVRSGRWWEFVPVAICIAMITYGLYMINSGMDQVFNPKIRS